MIKKKRVLLVGAHPDDIEIMCGGTMSKYQGGVAGLKSVIFAPCLEDPYNEGILEEYKASMTALGVKDIIAHDYPRDILENHVQDVRDILHGLKTSFNPRVVFCHSVNDLHQDHRAVAHACQTIFRDSATIFSGEIMRSTVSFAPNLFISLSYENMISKLRLLDAYKTQLGRAGGAPPKLKSKPNSPRTYTGSRTYFSSEIIEATARFRGCQVATRYAEAFELWGVIDR